jgi:myosin heavy subunit
MEHLFREAVLLTSRSSQAESMHHHHHHPDPSNNAVKAVTAGTKIRTQCASLVTALMDCQPHYVRCIKSNDDKQPDRIHDERVLHQIQYLGLLENVKVRRAGYAYRGEYGRFLERFKWLATATSGIKDIFHGSDLEVKSFLGEIYRYLLIRIFKDVSIYLSIYVPISRH